MFSTKKDRYEHERIQVYDALSDRLPSLASLESEYKGIQINGYSINKSKRGDGFLCITRIQVLDFPDAVELVGNQPAGHYVVWGFGGSPLEALADVEAQLQGERASLTEDKYATKKR